MSAMNVGKTTHNTSSLRSAHAIKWSVNTNPLEVFHAKLKLGKKSILILTRQLHPNSGNFIPEKRMLALHTYDAHITQVYGKF